MKHWLIRSRRGLAVLGCALMLCAIAPCSAFAAIVPYGLLSSVALTGTALAGIDAEASGTLLAADPTNDRIVRIDRSATPTASWGDPGAMPGQFESPLDVAVGSSGDIYVADTGNNRIQQLDSRGGFVRSWGCAGSGNGQFNLPSSIALDSAGNVYVADSGNVRIQKFSSSGQHIASWLTTSGGLPLAIAVDLSGDVLVATHIGYMVEKYSSEGLLLDSWGSFGTSKSQFRQASAICSDSKGCSYVADEANGTVQKFDAHGNYLARWGSSSTGGGVLQGPRGIAVAASGTVSVVESATARIQTFSNAWSVAKPTTSRARVPSRVFFRVSSSLSPMRISNETTPCLVIAKVSATGRILRKATVPVKHISAVRPGKTSFYLEIKLFESGYYKFQSTFAGRTSSWSSKVTVY